MSPSPAVHIELRPVSRMLALLLFRWLNDATITAHMATGRRPISEVEVGLALQKDSAEGAIVFEVWAANELCGVVGLYELDWIGRKAELRILLGQNRGCGVGTAAVRKLVAYGFRSLGLNRIWLGTAAGNTAARKAFERAGFRQEGLLAEDLFRDGRWYDNVRYAILASEWRSQHGETPA